MGSDGQQIGIVSIQEALRQAQELDLDLVESRPAGQPSGLPDHGLRQVQVRADVRQKEARKKQARVEVKEIKMRPKIDPHDYGTKKGHVDFGSWAQGRASR